MIGHADVYTPYDMFPGESEERVRHLMRKYFWTREEALNWFFSEPYDESDWADYE